MFNYQVSNLRVMRVKHTLAAQTNIEPVHEISYNLVCATSKASDQPAHMIRTFASRLSIL